MPFLGEKEDYPALETNCHDGLGRVGEWNGPLDDVKIYMPTNKECLAGTKKGKDANGDPVDVNLTDTEKLVYKRMLKQAHHC